MKKRTIARRGILAAALAASLGATALHAAEPDYPRKPVTIVMPFQAGGAGDALARILAQELSAEWKQPVLVDNRAGASGTIGNDFVARAAPDGYTLLLAITQVVQAPALGQKMPYDIQKDFTAITRVANAPHALVTADPEIASLKAYIDAGAKPGGSVSYGTYGAGTTPHIYTELFDKRNGVKAVHVPYKGAAPLMPDLLAARVQVAMLDVGTGLPYIKSGKLRAFAVVGTRRLPTLPDVPTFAELGYSGLEVVGWYGMFAPAGVPPALAEKIRTDVERVVRLPAIQSRIAAMGMDPASGPREDFSARIAADLVGWRKVVEEGGVKLD